VHGMVDEFGAGDFLSEGLLVRQGGVLDPEIIDPLDCRGIEGLYEDADQCAKEILRPRLGDYAVLGIDYKFMNGDGLFRLFLITDLTPAYEEKYSKSEKKRVRTPISAFTSESLSMVIFPSLNYNFGEGFELSAGALLNLGDDNSKFGDPAAGGNMVWTRGRFSF